MTIAKDQKFPKDGLVIATKVLAKGSTSTLYCHHTEPTRVIKVLDGKRAAALCDTEQRAYERLSHIDRPSSILQYFGLDEQLEYGLVLEFAPLGDLYSYLWHSQSISQPLKLCWARDAAQALSFMHDHNVLHCDVHAANCFLSGDLSLKLGDLGAASIDGDRPAMLYRTSHQLWLKEENGEWRKEISVASEIFALGCMLYNIETRNNLFAIEGREFDKHEIKRRLKERRYPSVSDDFLLGKIIEKCWSLKYASMKEIAEDIMMIGGLIKEY